MSVDEKIAKAREIAKQEVGPLLQRLVQFDTDISSPLDPPKQDAELVSYVRDYLDRIDAEIEVFEPPAAVYENHPMAFPGQSFAGRPVLWAKIKGRGTGKSLLFNGHYDTVPSEPVDSWTHPPHGGELHDNRIYGRGACDMKGGVAAALATVSGLVKAGVPLQGDILVNVVPFEEVNGLGTIATMRSGKKYRADGAVVCEPFGMDTRALKPIIKMRGMMQLKVTVRGRAGHAEIAQPHHSLGGAVNAIDKLMLVLETMRRISEQWRDLPCNQDDMLSAPSILATMLSAGSYWATWPDTATASFDVTYLKVNNGNQLPGQLVRKEIETRVLAACSADDWLIDNPPEFEWLANYAPAEADTADPFIVTVMSVLGEDSELIGTDTWCDAATLIEEGGIPTVVLGPGSTTRCHVIDEYNGLEELYRAIDVYMRIALTWTGTA